MDRTRIWFKLKKNDKFINYNKFIIEMEFKLLNYKDFNDKIRKYEMEIFDQLVIKEIFEVDVKTGDLAVDENDKFKIIGENKGSEIKLYKDNPFQNLNGKSNLITDNDHYGYMDVFGLDDSLQYKNGKILVCYKSTTENKIEKKIYQGCVWIFENERYIAMYGIRTSLNNFFTKTKGIGTELLNEVVKMASSSFFKRKRIILIPWPLEGMIKLLKKYNSSMENQITKSTTEIKKQFVNIQAEKENLDTLFLSKFTCTWNYWKLD
jgi:hypothetical protein